MALIVEDGTGLPNSESYASIQDGDDFYALYGENATWSAMSIQEKETALRRATRFLDLNYGWLSRPLDKDQALGFPRQPFMDTAGSYVEGLPQLLIDSTVQLAVESFLGNLEAQTISIKSESYGRTSVTYSDAKKNSVGVTLGRIFKYLSRYGTKGTHTVRLIRS